MAKISLEVVEALRATVSVLENTENYMWGHMGSCNCGNLAQVVTKRTKAEIHAFAMQGSGDWSEQLNHYCGETKMPIDLIIFELISFGFTHEDLAHLEKLSDTAVLNKLGDKKYSLKYNQKADVIVYLKTWANLIEENLLKNIEIPSFEYELKPLYV